MRAVSVVGFKKSGKTSLLGLLATALEEMGYSVGIIKHTSHSLDKQNTDTFWLMRPGRIVAGIGHDESAVFWPRSLQFSEATALVKADIVLVEGGKAYDTLPRIMCLKEPAEADELAFPEGYEKLKGKKSQGLAIASVGAKPDKKYGPYFPEINPDTARDLAKLVLEKAFVLPGLNCKACGHDNCAELGMDMLAGIATSDNCKVMPEENFSISFDGIDVPLNLFTARIIKSGIEGMLKELKGYTRGQEVSIRIK